MNISDIDCIVLAGGAGTRATYLPPSISKFLAPFGPEPFAAIFLRELETMGVRKVILALSRPHGGEAIAQWIFNNYAGKMSIFCQIQKTQLGIEESVLNAVAIADSNPVLIVNGDTLWDNVDLELLLLNSRVNSFKGGHYHAPARLEYAGVPAGIFLMTPGSIFFPKYYQSYPCGKFHDIGTPESYTEALKARGL